MIKSQCRRDVSVAVCADSVNSCFEAMGDPCILGRMNPQSQALVRNVRRRPSKLSERLSNEKIERARRMTPEERVTVALYLSDFCRELSLACSPKS